MRYEFVGLLGKIYSENNSFQQIWQNTYNSVSTKSLGHIEFTNELIAEVVEQVLWEGAIQGAIQGE